MKDEIMKMDPGRSVDSIQLEFLALDLSSLQHVVSAAESILSRKIKIDCLINNAGIMTCPYGVTKDGIESQFGVNHLGHFTFTLLLLPLMTKNSRVINLSSVAHFYSYSQGLLSIEYMKDSETAKKCYDSTKAYGQSKLCNILFTKKLAQLRPDLYVNSVHPGIVRTGLFRNFHSTYGVLFDTLSKGVSYFFKSPLEGALTSLYVATCNELTYTGEYFTPVAKVSKVSRFASDTNLQDNLFTISFQLLEEKLGGEMMARLKSNLSTSA
ncbi:hypothetical protein HMI56_004112 [Coelomomyces lativittatus]|nr:hypothetical protein HMI56_004112 [Coelomomyces lativittatus]